MSFATSQSSRGSEVTSAARRVAGRRMRVRLAGLVIGGIILTGLILSGAPAVTFPAGRTVTIIYTGDTRGWVEPCGCAEGVLGGLPRRATLLARLREQCPDALIVDAGALLASSSDPLKVPLIVERLAAMGYAAVNLGVADYPWRHQLGGQMTKHGLTGVSLDYAAVRGIGRQCVVKAGGPSAALPRLCSGQVRTGVRVGITGIAALPTGKQLAALRAVLSELRKSAELVVVLSAAGPADNLRLAREVGGMDLVIGQAPGKRPQLLRAGEVWLAAVTPEGGHVGKVTLTLGTPGIEAAHDLYALDERIPDDQPTLRAVQAYYDRVAQRLLSTSRGGTMVKAGYALASACSFCHRDIYRKWESTPHAGAIATLQAKDRDRAPECLQCHSEYFRRTQRAPLEKEQRAGVECASCHGEGFVLILRPSKKADAAKPGEKVCRGCHTPQRSPDFNFRRYKEKIRHW